MEFKPFPKIERLNKAHMNITQKIHGTNAQIFIIPSSPDKHGHPNLVDVDGLCFEIYCGSRTRWIYPGDDNYGFAAFVYENKEEFVRKLGVGQHFGEWAGPGINSGEGLEQRTFVLFDFWKYPPERPLPPQTVVVPVLYQGSMDLSKVQEVMNELKGSGSKLVPGFMRPEGVVVQCIGTRYKVVFDAEETQWKKSDGRKAKLNELVNQVDYSHLLQPIRLEKLFSRDEKFLRDFPKTLPTLVSEYFDDLISEGQIVGDKGQIKAIRKGASSQVFAFIRDQAWKALNERALQGSL